MSITCKKSQNSSIWVVVAHKDGKTVFLGTGIDEQSAWDNANSHLTLETMAAIMMKSLP